MSSILKTLHPSSDSYELKRELSIMHEVKNCEGYSFNDKIDNYLNKKDKKTKGAQVERYKIKYR